MKKDVNISEVAELLKKVQVTPENVSKEEKKKLKKCLNDPEVFLRAIGITANNLHGISPKVDEPKIYEDSEETVANNYIELALFVLDKMRDEGIDGLKDSDIKGLSARIDEDSFTIFLIAQKSIELDFYKYVTNDYPQLEEKLMEIDALISDIISFGDKDASFAKIKSIIDAAIPDKF